MVIDIAGGKGQNAESIKLLEKIENGGSGGSGGLYAKTYTKEINGSTFDITDSEFETRHSYIVGFTNWGSPVKYVTHAETSDTITINLRDSVTGYVQVNVLAF